MRWQWDVLDAFHYGRPWSWLMSIGRVTAHGKHGRVGTRPSWVGTADLDESAAVTINQGWPAHRDAGAGAAHVRELP